MEQVKLVKEKSGGFTYDRHGRPRFRFVEAVEFPRELAEEMNGGIPPKLVPWFRETARSLDMSVGDFWMMGMVKSLLVAADEPVTLEMAIHDADCHRLDPTYPIDFSSQLKEGMQTMPDRERILAGLRREWANFEAYAKARSEWLGKELKRLREIKEAEAFTAM